MIDFILEKIIVEMPAFPLYGIDMARGLTKDQSEIKYRKDDLWVQLFITTVL